MLAENFDGHKYLLTEMVRRAYCDYHCIRSVAPVVAKLIIDLLDTIIDKIVVESDVEPTTDRNVLCYVVHSFTLKYLGERNGQPD